MTRAVIVLALVAACGGGAGSLRLPVFRPAADQQTVVTERTTSIYELHLDGQVSTSKTIQVRKSHRQVLELEGALIVRQRVRYEVDEETAIDSFGNESRTAGPLAGRSYVVWRQSDALEAQHEDGSPITSAERAKLVAQFGAMGTTSATEVFLTGRTWARGEEVPVPRAVLEDFPLREGDELKSATFAWTGGDGKVATFRGTYAYTTSEGFEMQMVVQLRADRATGGELSWTYSAKIHGTVEDYAFVQTVESSTTFEDP